MTTQKHTGLIILIGAWIAIFAIAFILLSVWNTKQTNPNAHVNQLVEGDMIQVILNPNHQHAYMASGFINDHPVTFLLDTGATMIAIPQRIADNMGLQRLGIMRVNTAGGLTRAYLTLVKELKIGDITLHDLRASIVPRMPSNYVLLGMNALKKVDFEKRDGKLILKFRK